MSERLTRRAILAGGLAAWLPSGARAAEARRCIIQPLGPGVTEEDAEFVRKSLSAFYALPLETRPSAPLPRAAYYPPRGRYRAEKLLDFLDAEVPRDSFRVLGLTASDISTTKGKVYDWGVLGLATLDGRVCVLSSFRCKRGSNGHAHTIQRLGKVAVHEIGHTLGLPHCPVRGCLMEDGQGTVTTLDHEYALCERSRAALRAAGHGIVAEPDPPWPKPG